VLRCSTAAGDGDGAPLVRVTLQRLSRGRGQKRNREDAEEEPVRVTPNQLQQGFEADRVRLIPQQTNAHYAARPAVVVVRRSAQPPPIARRLPDLGRTVLIVTNDALLARGPRPVRSLATPPPPRVAGARDQLAAIETPTEPCPPTAYSALTHVLSTLAPSLNDGKKPRLWNRA
jgi:hypothetical protein